MGKESDRINTCLYFLKFGSVSRLIVVIVKFACESVYVEYYYSDIFELGRCLLYTGIFAEPV